MPKLVKSAIYAGLVSITVLSAYVLIPATSNYIKYGTKSEADLQAIRSNSEKVVRPNPDYSFLSLLSQQASLTKSVINLGNSFETIYEKNASFWTLSDNQFIRIKNAMDKKEKILAVSECNLENNETYKMIHVVSSDNTNQLHLKNENGQFSTYESVFKPIWSPPADYERDTRIDHTAKLQELFPELIPSYCGSPKQKIEESASDVLEYITGLTYASIKREKEVSIGYLNSNLRFKIDDSNYPYTIYIKSDNSDMPSLINLMNTITSKLDSKYTIARGVRGVDSSGDIIQKTYRLALNSPNVSMNPDSKSADTVSVTIAEKRLIVKINRL